jgi:hypothetical protein
MRYMFWLLAAGCWFLVALVVASSCWAREPDRPTRTKHEADRDGRNTARDGRNGFSKTRFVCAKRKCAGLGFEEHTLARRATYRAAAPPPRSASLGSAWMSWPAPG